ncbi:Uncharacterised protein [Vibrio cholerae]|uniref:Uncharacterized protein n=1 Tax=Vibrio cholerae TaxID=666 RepID=A0A655R2M7_VIBCL|nr:Uncharacterised protein [Vibrio cholerae]
MVRPMCFTQTGMVTGNIIQIVRVATHLNVSWWGSKPRILLWWKGIMRSV